MAKKSIKKYDLYILDEEKNVIRTSSARKWAQFIADFTVRVVKQETVEDLFVSTVFLGLSRLNCFETMAFDDKGDSVDAYFARYDTWEEARLGHAKIVKKIKSDIKLGTEDASCRSTEINYGYTSSKSFPKNSKSSKRICKKNKISKFKTKL